MSNSLWQQMAIALMGIVLIFGSVVAAGDSYVHSPPPPSHPPAPYYNYMSPPHDPLIIMVIGEVYCFRCSDQNLHDTKHLLKDATVEVICKVGTKIMKSYGKSKSNGVYNISVSVENYYFDDYVKYESPIICNTKLYAPPKGSSCNIFTKLNEGTNLKVIKSEGKYELVLKAKPFAFATYDENGGSPSSQYPYPPYYHYNYSSPSPIPLIPLPPYYYQSPSLSKELPLARNKKKPPPPSSSPPPPFPETPFDYFTLAETWPTTFCKNKNCVTIPSMFTIHGLWPSKTLGTQPRDCDPTNSAIKLSRLGKLKKDLDKNWPCLTDNSLLGNLKFWTAQWASHGTCSLWLMDSIHYFDQALQIYKRNDLKAILQMENISPNGTKLIDPISIVNAITKHVGVNPQILCTEYEKNWYLLEIRICLDKSTQPQYQNCATTLINCQNHVYFP